MKSTRQNKILEIITENAIDRQEDLIEHLKKCGFTATQATISRDIKELRLIKTSTGDGNYKYVVSPGASKNNHTLSRFETIFKESVLNVDYAGNTVLVKCYTGMANAACEVFDALVWDNVVGTLSGDDTFFILMRTEEAAQKITRQIYKYIAY